MKKVGKQVCLLATDKSNPRNGEGAFLRLKDGRIMYAYTKYVGDSWTDHSTACIAAVYSSDEGRSFGDGRVLIEKRPEQLNIMSVSLIRLRDGALGILYLEKTLCDGMLNCTPVLRKSYDEGESFGKEIYPIPQKGCNGVVNDRVLRLSTGRILFATEMKPPRPVDAEAKCGKVAVFYSDDEGESWARSTELVTSPYNDTTQFQEPGLAELADGRVWLYIRTGYGCQYQSFSRDGGVSWEAPTPNWRFTSPDSPMLVKQAGELSVAIFNPVPFSCVIDRREVWGSPKRTPFVLAVSRDGGASFTDMSYNSRNGKYTSFVKNCYYLEDDPRDSYCYPSALEVEGGVLIAYYHSYSTDICLNVTKIIRVDYDELT